MADRNAPAVMRPHDRQDVRDGKERALARCDDVVASAPVRDIVARHTQTVPDPGDPPRDDGSAAIERAERIAQRRAERLQRLPPLPPALEPEATPATGQSGGLRSLGALIGGMLRGPVKTRVEAGSSAGVRLGGVSRIIAMLAMKKSRPDRPRVRACAPLIGRTARERDDGYDTN